MPVTYEQALAAVRAAQGRTASTTAPTASPSRQERTAASREAPQGGELIQGNYPQGAPTIGVGGGYNELYYGPQYQPEPNVQPTTPESVYTNMPNADKLTPAEHWLYRTLPGFTESTVGKALAGFSEGWIGKALNVLDIGAEGLERTIGLAAQYEQVAGTDREQDFLDHISEAWNAGTLTYDVTNLPTFTRDEKGAINGISIPTDLPGAAGLTEARLKLISGVPLDQVRQEYYSSLGALQLRAQLYDTYGHVVLDPINIIAGQLKPVDRIKVLSEIARTVKYTDEGIEDLRALIKTANEAQNIGDLARIARDSAAVKDVASFQKISELEKAGDIAGLTKIAGDLTEANKMTRMEKFAVALTGGEPLKATAESIKKQWWNPFALTPASRAHELLYQVGDNVGTYIVSKFDDPEDIGKAIGRAAKSATGSDFGHAMLTPAGRPVQAILAGLDNAIQKDLEIYRLTETPRIMLQNVAQMALGSIDNGALDTVMNAITKGGGELKAIAKAAGTTVDDLAAIGKALEDVPYHSELFKALAMNRTYDLAGKLGVTLYGVKSQGLFEKMSLAMKSAESLAFLRINPAFLARNFMNNELTMIARGIFTRIGANETDDLLRKIGYLPGVFEPGRLRQGFSMIGEATKTSEAIAAGSGQIFEALRGKGGWLDNITNKLSDVKLGKLDMGELAQRVEVSARSRATTYGYTECYRNMLWKPGKAFPHAYDVINSSTRQWIEANKSSEFMDVIMDKISTAWHEKDLDGILSADNLRANIKSVTADASKKLGYDVESSLPVDFIPTIEKGLEEAIPKGRSAVQDFVNRTRIQLQNRLDDLNEIEISRIASETEAALKLEGPKIIPKLAANYIDEFWEAHIAHASRMEDLSVIGDKGMQNATWKSLRLEDDNYFTRVYGRLDAALQGVKKGAKGSGVEIPDSILSDFKGWRTTTRDFFKTSAKEWNDFFDGKSTKTYREIADMLDSQYAKLITDEDAFLRNIDKSIAGMIPDEAMRQTFIKTREVIANARRLDKEGVAQFFKDIRGLSPAAKEAKFKEFWNNRQQRWRDLQALEKKSSGALAGDQEELQWANSLVEQEKWSKEAEQQAIEAGEEVAPPIENVGQVSGQELGQKAGQVTGQPQNFVPDAGNMGIYSAPIGAAEDQYYIHRGFQSLDAIERSAIEISEKAPLRASDLPEDIYNDLAKYVELVKGKMADARYTSLRYGEWKADTALLNYNRRYNFDTWLGTIMPFEFWMTHSLGQWALGSIDRPAMLSTYLRMRKTLETMGAPNQKLPDRLKGSIRINLPFAPKWMGQFFVDPIKASLPFDQFLYPLEKWRTNQYTIAGQAERLLTNKLQNGEGDAAEIQNALDAHSGNTWNLALREVEANNEDLKFDAWDFASLMSSPHAPLVWAKEILDGTPENIGPFMPLTRMSRGVFTALGIEDFAFAPHNIEAKVRKTIGLPAYDKWDDYRTARMLSDMAADGEISVFDMVNAANTKEGDIYNRAVDKMNKEFAVGALGSILGIPLKAFPTGELKQRTLYDEFQRAYKAYDGGDVDALNKFFDKYPEYEARLMQYKDPQVMARDFVVDKLWSAYNEYSPLNKQEIKDQLGDEFAYAFLNKDTRSIDSIDLPTLQVWLKLMGGNPPGTMTQKVTKPLELTPPDIAWRINVFNQTRNSKYPGWYDIQSNYFDLTKGKARQTYLKQYPMLKSYWNWRNDFMMRNPDTVQYLTDLTQEGEEEKYQYGSVEEMQAIQANQPNFTWQEWQGNLGNSLSNLVADNILGGESLSETARNRLERIAENMGISYEMLLQKLEMSLTQGQ
ncbi:MAG: hypothetical protein WC455_20205 [Dehalococcoidia bacterium]